LEGIISQLAFCYDLDCWKSNALTFLILMHNTRGRCNSCWHAVHVDMQFMLTCNTCWVATSKF